MSYKKKVLTHEEMKKLWYELSENECDGEIDDFTGRMEDKFQA